MPITSRPYRPSDYPRLLALQSDIYRMAGSLVYATPGDIEWWVALEDDPNAIERAHVWLDGRDLIGFAWPLKLNVEMMARPDHPELEARMLTWAERNLRAIARANHADSLPLSAWSHTSHAARIAVLQQRGYVRQDEFFYYRLRAVNTPFPEPALPPGYRLSDMARESNVEDRVEVHREAFAPSRMTVEKYRRARASTHYRPDLDLVAVAPDGSYAAFAILWLDPPNNIGVFEPVGTRPAHQQKGLGKAIMYEGLRKLKALGVETALVSTAHDDPAAIRLYESTGFHEIERFYKWTRMLKV